MSLANLCPVPKKVRPQPGSLLIDAAAVGAALGYTTDRPLPAGVSWRQSAADGSPERYHLQIRADGIHIESADKSGKFAAMMTLRQIIRGALADVGVGVDANGAPPNVRGSEPTRACRLPCLEIDDEPDFPIRGVMIDISRNRVPTMRTIRRLVDLLSEVKINHLELYTEHTFAYAGHEVVWGAADPFTAGEIRELDEYCYLRGIELVPNQNSFGHMEQWLRHAAYRDLAECPDGWVREDGSFDPNPVTISPVAPRASAFLSGLYDELLPNFRSRLFNVGLDETLELGQGRSAEACRRDGVARVYLDFVLRVHKLVSDRGHRMMFWGDIILKYPELIPELPKDVLATTWGYERDHPFEQECAAFEAAEVPYLVCPGTSSWNSFGGRWKNAQENIRRAAAAAREHHAKGLLITDWGDYGHWQQHPFSLPGFVFGAACAWSGAASDGIDVARFLNHHVFRDSTERYGTALLELGSVCELYGHRIHNASALFAAVLDTSHPFYPAQMGQFRDVDFGVVREAIHAAELTVAGARPAAEDGPTLMREFAFAVRCMEFGNDLLEARFPGRQPSALTDGPSPHEADEPIDLAAISQPLRDSLGRRALALSDELGERWIERSRPGGLPESRRRFTWLAGRLGTSTA